MRIISRWGSHHTFAQANIDNSQDDSRDDSEGNQSLSKTLAVVNILCTVCAGHSLHY